MRQTKLFTEIVDLIINHRLGKALDQLENRLLTFPQKLGLDDLLKLKNDYQLMTDYWQKGCDDPEREQLYERLLQSIYEQALFVNQCDFFFGVTFSTFEFALPREKNFYWPEDEMRRTLESFVSDVAMLSLEPEPSRSKKAAKLYKSHEHYMSLLFSYLWTTYAWSVSDVQIYEDMLLAPTIDSIDQQLMVSAISLATMNYFDINKFRVLINVYSKATDEAVRQRALVGWVLSLDNNAVRVYREIHEMVVRLCEDKKCCNELAELQVQLAYCISAEDDNRTIESEIIPDLMKHANLRVNKGMIEEVEDDSMEDILHPDAVEEKMEKLEGSLKRMADMQQQGVDVYFGGFKQMKRFPFFSEISRWFVPFYPEHPAISKIWNDEKNKIFLHTIISAGSFCDSDKYSFLLAFDDVFKHLPKNMIEIIQRGDAVPLADVIPSDEMSNPAYIRRIYLQNLYRFFRIHSNRSEFANPFDIHETDYVFFANPVFKETGLEAHFDHTAAFFLKRKLTEAAVKVLDNYREMQQGYNYLMMRGRLLMRQTDKKNLQQVCSYYQKALQMKPESENAKVGLARVSYALGDYPTALQLFEQLMSLKPSNANYKLNAALCMSFLGRQDEAQEILYKLNYEFPDDLRVTRALAWVLTEQKKYPQAIKLYNVLLAIDTPDVDDLLNNAYCQWFSGDVAGAIASFKLFLEKKPSEREFNIESEFRTVEASRLSAHGISSVQVSLMLDVLDC